MVMYPTYGRNLKWNLEHIVIKKARKKVPALPPFPSGKR
jgi:hypothetical protein